MVGQVTFGENSIGVDGGAVALGQVVEDNDLFTALDELLYCDTADIAFTSRHKHFYDSVTSV